MLTYNSMVLAIDMTDLRGANLEEETTVYARTTLSFNTSPSLMTSTALSLVFAIPDTVVEPNAIGSYTQLAAIGITLS